MDKARVYTVFRESCYDEDADDPWGNHHRSSGEALVELQMEKRLSLGKHMHSLGHTAEYYHQILVWTDICNLIFPRNVQRAGKQALSRKGGKGWFSKSKFTKN